MKKIFTLFLFVFLSIISCTTDNDNVVNIPTEPITKNLTIFIVNDIHGQIDNFSKVKYIIDKERQKTNVIITSGGDIFSGNPIVDNYPEKGYPIIDIMNRVGFDVSVIGNHEFDYGETNLKNRINQANFNWVCSNVEMNSSGIPQPFEYTTISVDNLKVTFLGLIETDGKNDAIIPSTHPWRVKNLTFERPENVVSKYSKIKEQEDSDLYIALTHIGYSKNNGKLGDYQLAEQFPYFDLIIGGHSHSKVENTVNNIPIFQAGGYLKNLGKIELTITDKKIESIEYELIDLSSRSEHDSELKKIIEDYNDNPFFNEIVGYSHLNHDKPQVGSFIAEAIRAKLNVDLTFQNTGGVRSSLNFGDITKREIFEILPFNNPTMIYEMTVAEVKTFLKESGSGFYYSGVKFENSNGSIDVKDLNGNIIPDNTILSVGLNDYIPAVYDVYFPNNGIVQPQTDAETVISYLEEINSEVNYSNSNYFKFQ
ncbi:MAG: hypothetical protein GQ552_07475 [Flavobacteriaceae bacterium]|nr:hypothetical protein [Flavobacteriaceae bacterium]